jgi:hypothetical protein
MASQEPFEHLQHKLWSKERLGVKLTIWLPTIKSRESTWSQCVQVESNTPSKSFWGELQVCFRLHSNQRSELGVMSSQSPGSLNRDSFRTLLWESRDKKPFGCRCHEETQRILYGGKVVAFPRIRAVVSQVSPCCPWLVLTPRVIPNVI